MRYPRVIAHRCGGALAPENTLAGLFIAKRLGCHGVEFDAMLSADGVPVLMHDETLNRTTSGRGLVAGRSLAALRALDAGVSHGAAYQGERIPTLEETLALCAALGLWANVEIKPSEGREAETGRIVGRLLAQRWNGGGVVSSFSAVALAAARAEASQFDYALLSDGIAGDWREQLEKAGCQAWHCAKDADPALIAALADAGVPVACYTVNGRDQAAALFAAGAVAIFTDRPDRWAPEEM